MGKGIILAAGLDSPGFLSRCARWFARFPTNDGKVAVNWRAGCARSLCGSGHSSLYYEAKPEIHAAIRDPSGPFSQFIAEETARNTERFIQVKDADSLLFDIFNQRDNDRIFSHYYVSFKHIPERGFLGRLSRSLATSKLVVVQHDSLQSRPTTEAHLGEVLHATRVYVPMREYALAERIISSAITDAAVGDEKPHSISLSQEPNAAQGIQRGILKEKSFAYVSLIADVRAHIQGWQPHDVDSVINRALPATTLVGHCADVVESAQAGSAGEIQSANRPLIRLSMRSLGGWTFVTCCVASLEKEALEIRRLLRSRLTSNGVNAGRILQCESSVTESSPWATNRPGLVLPQLRHHDRPGFLANYFDAIGDDLAERVSVVQYDSWVQQLPRRNPEQPLTTHRLCISASPEGTVDDVNRWETRHRDFCGRECL